MTTNIINHDFSKPTLVINNENITDINELENNMMNKMIELFNKIHFQSRYKNRDNNNVYHYKIIYKNFSFERFNIYENSYLIAIMIRITYNNRFMNWFGFTNKKEICQAIYNAKRQTPWKINYYIKLSNDKVFELMNSLDHLLEKYKKSEQKKFQKIAKKMLK